ncbi:MAG: hypothetical protein GKS04_04660 [Candidatus Mycalebacterium zealandia]|nr:MAG: hypothetical protein GKS04_04660 [Candidatus Mycalebacterium zealandia]
MENFFLYKKETEKPHFILIIGSRAWIVPFLDPFEAAKKRFAVEVSPDEAGIAKPFDSAADLIEKGRVVVNRGGDGKIDFTVRETSGAVMSGGFVFVLPSWGIRTKRRLWLLVKSGKPKSKGDKNA